MMNQERVAVDAYEFSKRPMDDDRFKVTLDMYECEMVMRVVNDWIENDNARGIRETRSNAVTLKNRIGAQVGFGKLFNCYNAWDKRYGRYDHFLTLWIEGEPAKKMVEVKYTGHDEGHLCASLDTPKRGISDIYALMFGAFPTFWFRGCIPGSLFIRDENIKELWGQRQYAAEQKKLCYEFFFAGD